MRACHVPSEPHRAKQQQVQVHRQRPRLPKQVPHVRPLRPHQPAPTTAWAAWCARPMILTGQSGTPTGSPPLPPSPSLPSSPSPCPPSPPPPPPLPPPAPPPPSLPPRWCYTCLPDKLASSGLTATMSQWQRFNVHRMPGGAVCNATIKATPSVHIDATGHRPPQGGAQGQGGV